MANDFLNKLKKEYSVSGLPTVIADETGILWANSIGSFIMKESRGDIAFIFDGDAPRTGLITKSSGGESHVFNVIAMSDGGTGKRFYIIELVSSERLSGIFSAAAIRDYVSYLCAKVRTVLSNITVTSDRLFDDISVGTSDEASVTDGLNSIQNNIMSLAREIVQPEQLYMFSDILRSGDTSDSIILLDREMTEIVAEIRKRLGDSVRISEDYDKGIYFHMNVDAFETVIAAMTAECCSSRLYPDRLVFSAKRLDSSRAEVSVMLVNIGGRYNNICSGAAAEADERGLKRNLFFDYMCDMLGMKNGARFTRLDMPDGRVYKMEIDAVPAFTSVSEDIGEIMRRTVIRRTDLSEKIDFLLGDMRTEEKYYYIPEEISEEDKIIKINKISGKELKNGKKKN